MASTDFDFDKDLERELAAMIADQSISEFSALRELALTILPVVKVRLDKDGQNEPCKGDPVAVKKVDGAMKMFMPKKPHFIVIIDYGVWSEADERQKKILVHRALIRIAAEKTDEGMKIGMKKPDIVEHTATIARFGAFTDVLLGVREAMRNTAMRLLPEYAEPGEEHPPEPEHEEQAG